MPAGAGVAPAPDMDQLAGVAAGAGGVVYDCAGAEGAGAIDGAGAATPKVALGARATGNTDTAEVTGDGESAGAAVAATDASVPAVVTGVVPNAAGVAAAVVPVVAGAPDDGGVAIAAAGGVVVAGCVASVGTAAALFEGASIARVHDAVEPVADAVDVAASVAPDDADGIAVAAGAGMLATGCDAVALNDVSIDADGAGVEGCAADTPAVFAAGVGAAAAAGAGERVTESDTGPAAAPIIDDAAGPMADAADDTR